MLLSTDAKIYFASDFHLGVPDHQRSLVREKILVKWLDEVKKDASVIFLMGDIFDFWFEYKTVVPKGFVRLLGKLAEITDSGIDIHLFRGNHDIWAFNYLQEELNIQLHRYPLTAKIGNKTFYLAHGDGLGPGDKGYKILKKVFEFKPSQWLFKWLHPDLGARMGLYFSKKSRIANLAKEGKHENHLPIEKEPLYYFSKDMLAKHPEINYFIFGHMHKPTQHLLSNNAELVVLGDWITHFSYAVFDGEKMKLKYFK
ncbi:MAG: UDP-2,3-diacylglucosamine diphosphatase [Bacteroidetes bacterium]|nr:UDP-2,3-diacylglucosamine diphosphatase [Bacteroidota bacterium]